jgi:acyl carrier protein
MLEPPKVIKIAGIEEKTKAIICDKLGVKEKKITMKSNFKNDLGANSLDILELIIEFEKEFNIAIPDQEEEKIRTVEDAIKYIKKNIEQSISSSNTREVGTPLRKIAG